MRVIVGTVFWCLLYPGIVLGAVCSEFPWKYPREMVMPSLVVEGEEAREAGRHHEAHRLLTSYLKEQNEGIFSEGVKFLVASLPHPTDEPGKEFLKQIERLQQIRKQYPQSSYAPWALCVMGDLYWKVGWYSEANGLFEEFLKTFPEHSLAGGVMIEAGRGYLENGQYLEAALIFRRVIEEPKWEAHRLKGALGLATTTALSKAWKQALYWFRVVEAEQPELLRRSPQSLYYFGETELTVGSPARAIDQFLTTVNLHPGRPETGLALNRLSQEMFKSGREYLGLWFAEQAYKHFPRQEGGRRGKAALTRWVVGFLSRAHSKEDLVKVYQRLDDLEIYLSISWDSVLETARALSQAPEADLSEESTLWMAKGYEQVGDVEGAISSFSHLMVNASTKAFREEGQSHLHDLLHTRLKRFKEHKAWVELLKFHDEYRDAFNLLPPDREGVLTIAEAYQKVALPEQALQWYDQLLTEHPRLNFREEIMLRKVGLADDLNQSDQIRKFATAYLQEFPEGKWRSTVATILGMEAMRNARYEEAIAQFSEVIDTAGDPEAKRFALRNRARVYRMTEQMEKAQQDYRTLVAGDSPHVLDVVGLADVLYDEGDYAQAASWYQQVEDNTPSPEIQVWATYRLGLTLERLGKHEEAVALLKEAGELQADAPETEHAIRLAASAVLDEFSLKHKPRVGPSDGETQP